MDHIINLLQHKKQIILQGPPGTGKTYLAKNIAEKMIYGEVSTDKTLQKKRLQTADQFALVQFHPSFSYEDFVRGISAKSEGGKIIYETENKLLTTFAEKATYNIRSARIDPQDLSREQLVEKILLRFAERIQVHLHENGPFEITKAVAIVEVEEDAFRYAGIGTWKASQRMKFKDLIYAQLHGITTRQDLKNLAEVSGLAKVHASYYIKVLNRFQEEFGQELAQTNISEISQPTVQAYLLIIDEINRANLPAVLGELIYALEYRDEVVNSMYVLDGDSSLVLPENLYP
jgi:DNA polymerase III delta prime subunit